PTAPKRSVRVVLFMNEENGLAGAKAYAKTHAKELGKHVAAIEVDFGSGKPLGVSMNAGAGASAALSPWLTPLASLGAGEIVPGEGGGADLYPLNDSRVPTFSIHQEGSHYFDVHHSAADTLDKVDPMGLATSAAALVGLTYALAQMP